MGRIVVPFSHFVQMIIQKLHLAVLRRCCRHFLNTKVLNNRRNVAINACSRQRIIIFFSYFIFFFVVFYVCEKHFSQRIPFKRTTLSKSTIFFVRNVSFRKLRQLNQFETLSWWHVMWIDSANSSVCFIRQCEKPRVLNDSLELILLCCNENGKKKTLTWVLSWIINRETIMVNWKFAIVLDVGLPLMRYTVCQKPFCLRALLFTYFGLETATILNDDIPILVYIETCCFDAYFNIVFNLLWSILSDTQKSGSRLCAPTLIKNHCV